MRNSANCSWLGTAAAAAVAALVVATCVTEAAKLCPSCGNMTVPYPLSTESDCGDEGYKAYCNSDVLQFMSENGSLYRILSINPSSMRLVLENPGMITGTCVSNDVRYLGLHLNDSLPFNVTSTNTVMMFNCSNALLSSPINCGANSPCNTYMADVESAKPCKNTTFCCTFTAGGSATQHDIRAHAAGCMSYTSILNYNSLVPPSRWNYGIELQWSAPHEPICNTQADCVTQPHSSCSADSETLGKSRCFCLDPYFWDPVHGNCTKNLCGSSDNCGSTDRRGLIAGLVAGLCAAIILVGVALFLYRRKAVRIEAQARVMKEREEILSSGGLLSARLYSKNEMKKATDNFSSNRILGRGGFGSVYKGVLEDGTVVAVKVAHVGNTKGTEQVLNEVRILSQVNHRNLVKLLGCCVDMQQPLMIYGYVPNGTLYEHLHGEREGLLFLDWNRRLKIAVQTAEAVAYLHSTAHMSIYHRDIKSSNILLDECLNAKVSDFGLSRLAEPGMSHISTCVQGTLGYLDPEYYRNFQLTDKSDVYSFGVVLLEIVTSQKAVDFTRDADFVNLVEFAQFMFEQGRMLEIVDSRLMKESGDYDFDSVGSTATLPPIQESIKAVLSLALGCVQEKRHERPTMKEVSEELHYIVGIQTLSPVGIDSSSDSEKTRFLLSVSPQCHGP